MQQVTDGANDNSSRLGDFKYDPSTKGGTDYSYDVNGNLTADQNKKISGIVYNHLNLPQTITVTGKGTITYTYDASGNKLKKEVAETGQPLKTTLYLAGAVYENDVLQFLGHEEGRIRYKPLDASYQYDYFLKDHLGNVRMVLTEEHQVDPYPRLDYDGNSTEINNQDSYWDNSSGQSINVTGVRTSRPGGFGDQQTYGDYVQLLTKSTGAVGATKLIKVMSGDKIHAKVDYYYTANNANNGSANGFNSLLSSLAAALFNSSGATQIIKDNAGAVTSQVTSDPNAAGFFWPENSNGGYSQPPKAYLHVLLFDEQFKFDEVNSFVQQVANAPGQVGSIDKYNNPVEVKYNGYAYIYISNESDDAVYFDNLVLNHERGQLLEETHYYPFGLTMAGISSEAAKGTDYAENKKGFNGNELQSKEFSDLSGLAWYDFNARTYDPQTGRFIQIDPTPEDGDQESLTPYHFSRNNPIRFNDPDGKCPSCILGGIIGAIVDYGEQVATNYVQGNENPWTNNINLVSISTAAVAGALTSGGSVIESVAAKFAVKTGASVINNTVSVRTSSEGLKTTFETNGVNIVKNTAIDLVADKVAGKVAKKVEGSLSKVGVTNAGRLSSTSKSVLKALGKDNTRATTATVKAGLKATTTVVAKTVESSSKVVTNTKRDEIKDKTNQ